MVNMVNNVFEGMEAKDTDKGREKVFCDFSSGAEVSKLIETITPVWTSPKGMNTTLNFFPEDIQLAFMAVIDSIHRSGRNGKMPSMTGVLGGIRHNNPRELLEQSKKSIDEYINLPTYFQTQRDNLGINEQLDGTPLLYIIFGEKREIREIIDLSNNGYQKCLDLLESIKDRWEGKINLIYLPAIDTHGKSLDGPTISVIMNNGMPLDAIINDRLEQFK